MENVALLLYDQGGAFQLRKLSYPLNEQRHTFYQTKVGF